jgi:hypothetical protein
MCFFMTKATVSLSWGGFFYGRELKKYLKKGYHQDGSADRVTPCESRR